MRGAALRASKCLQWIKNRELGRLARPGLGAGLELGGPQLGLAGLLAGGGAEPAVELRELGRLGAGLQLLGAGLLLQLGRHPQLDGAARLLRAAAESGEGDVLGDGGGT